MFNHARSQSPFCFVLLFLAVAVVSENPVGSALAEPLAGRHSASDVEPAGAERPNPQLVEVYLVGEMAADETWGERITSWFDPERFQVNVEPRTVLEPEQILSPKQKDVISVWLTRDGSSHVRLYFTWRNSANTGERYLMRRLKLERGLDEIEVERITQVVHLSAVALLDGQLRSERKDVEQSLRREPSPQQEPSPRQEPSPAPQTSDIEAPRAVRRRPHTAHEKRPLVWWFGLGYQLGHHFDEGLWHGPRASTHLDLGLGFSSGVLLSAILPTTRTLADAVELELSGGSAALVLLRKQVITVDFSLAWFAGPSLTMITYRPTATPDASIAATAGERELRPGIELGGRVHVGRQLPRLVIAAGGTVALTRTHYDVVLSDTSREVVARAPTFAPSVALELEW